MYNVTLGMADYNEWKTLLDNEEFQDSLFAKAVPDQCHRIETCMDVIIDILKCVDRKHVKFGLSPHEVPPSHVKFDVIDDVFFCTISQGDLAHSFEYLLHIDNPESIPSTDPNSPAHTKIEISIKYSETHVFSGSFRAVMSHRAAGRGIQRHSFVTFAGLCPYNYIYAKAVLASQIISVLDHHPIFDYDLAEED